MTLITDTLVQSVIGAAIEVHRHLGPGLLESTYRTCLAHELFLRDIPFEGERRLPVIYKGLPLDCGYRLDFVIDKRLIVEVKAVDRLVPIHTAQVLTYLKLMNTFQGLLINFNVAYPRNGLRSVILSAGGVQPGSTCVVESADDEDVSKGAP